MRTTITALSLSVLASVVALSPTLHAQDQVFDENGNYRRATEDKDNVKEKIYPKKGTLELNLPDVGWVLNTAFVDTYLLHGGLTYYTSETWGWGVELAMGINSDKKERTCLESFYNDPNDVVAEECGDGSGLDDRRSNFGPAYMPIREIKFILAFNAVWNPIYGKQLLFLSSTSHFDVFFTMGGGVVMSDYYEQKDILNNGKKARALYTENPNSPECQQRTDMSQPCGQLDGGASRSETNSYGEAGRPEVQAQTTPFINLGFGQRYHFWDRFHLRFEIRSMTLLGTPDGFENYFAVWGGLGMRL